MKNDRLVLALVLADMFNCKCAAGRKLIELCGGLEAVFDAGRNGLADMLPGHMELVDGIFDDGSRRRAEDEADWADAFGVKLLYYEDDGYPYRLRECDDAPLVLYCMGDADLNAPRMLSVVGTRKASYYGKTFCSSVIAGLGENDRAPSIVSGLAFGIDSQAHRSALDAGIPTIAVLPTGLDTIYPGAHRDLAKLIVRNGGALVTDFPRHTVPVVANFIRRNRIIAGMSDATLLVESFARGGGLITTGLANSYDREVFAVPGRTVDPSFDGCNRLIETNQARLVTGAASIERAMGWEMPRRRKKKIPEIDFGDDPLKASVVSLLRERSPVRFNTILDLARKPDGSRFSSGEVSALLLELEVEGRLGAGGGDMYELIG